MIHETFCGCIASRPTPDYAEFWCPNCPECSDREHFTAFQAARRAWWAEWEQAITEHAETCGGGDR